MVVGLSALCTGRTLLPRNIIIKSLSKDQRLKLNKTRTVRVEVTHFDLRGRSDSRSSSVCYVRSVRDISMSVEYIGTLCRGEIAALVSLFPNHVSRLYRRTKWPVRSKIIPSLRSALWPDFCKQKESGRDLSQVSECPRS
jgi:hypothetical protein